MSSPEFPSSGAGSPEIAQVEEPGSWRSLVVPAIVVILGLGIAWALFAHYGKDKPDASGTILSQRVYPVVVDPGTQPTDQGMAGDAEPRQDEVLLLVDAKVTNISHRPITLFDMVANVKVDGQDNQSVAALPEDIDRAFQAFPDLSASRTQPLLRHQTIAPGQSVQGLMVFSYPWSQQQWDKHTAANITVSFQDARSVVIPLH
jgi:hypothetical protein